MAGRGRPAVKGLGWVRIVGVGRDTLFVAVGVTAPFGAFCYS